jgi:hypothetical protein
VGKEVLIKSVLQAIPTYKMSVFRLPTTLCREINSLFGKFWWGHKENDRKISWMAWNGLGRNKKLGYRELESFNLSMLAKQGWRLSKFPGTLAARVMREKYYPTSDFLGSSWLSALIRLAQHLELKTYAAGGVIMAYWRWYTS